jgi:hypothetical protein
MQLNGISIQPKIGSDFAAQYGEVGSALNANTMAQASNPSGQQYNQVRVNQNSNPEKIAEQIAKYETAQGNYARAFHNI